MYILTKKEIVNIQTTVNNSINTCNRKKADVVDIDLSSIGRVYNGINCKPEQFNARFAYLVAYAKALPEVYRVIEECPNNNIIQIVLY